MRPRRARGWLTAAVIVLPLACGNMSPEALACEEAVARLQDCCPGFDARPVACIYETACGLVDTSPDISVTQSQCIQGESCSTLVKTGVCARAEKAWTTGIDNLTPPPPTTGQVCP